MRYYILCFHFIVCSNIQVIIDLVSERNTNCILCASVLRASLKLRPANSFSVRTLNHILLAFSIKYLEPFLLVSLPHPHTIQVSNEITEEFLDFGVQIW